MRRTRGPAIGSCAPDGKGILAADGEALPGLAAVARTRVSGSGEHEESEHCEQGAEDHE